MIASAMCHKKLDSTSVQTATTTPATTNLYSRAIRCLIEWGQGLSPAVLLIFCLLLILCENLRSQPKKAMVHLRAGL